MSASQKNAKRVRPRYPKSEWKNFSAEQKKRLIDSGNPAPKKNKKKSKKNQKVQGTLSKTLEPRALKEDVRVLNSGVTDLSLRNQTKAVPVEMALESVAIINVCQGYVSKALERGFAAEADTSQTPFYALTYMCQILLNYVQGAQIPVTQLPYWLLCLGHAVSPKSCRFQNGEVTYRFKYVGANPIAPTVSSVLGYSPFGYQWTTGWSDNSTLIDMFPTVSTTPIAYTDALGQIAFQQLCQWMSNNTADPMMKKVTALVPSTILTPFMKDVSAFSVVGLPQGVGASGLGGGFAAQCQLEVPIYHPILSLFASPILLLNDQSNRFFNWASPVAGDGVFLGAALSDMFTTGETFAKRMTRFHCINFLEFGDVLAMWVQQIVQSLFNDVSTLDDAASVLCPLTLQEVLLILRNTMMGAFKETQSAVQGLYPIIPASGTDNQFQPYLSSANTCTLETLDMHLPVPFVENIRALIGKKIKIRGNDVVWFCPVLGQMTTDGLVSANYPVTYAYGGGFGPVPVFQTGALFQKRTPTAKGEFTTKTMLETAISLVDGSSGSSLVQINDPARLKTLVTLWNTWLTNSGVATYSSQLGSVGTEKGITALSSISMTRHVTTVPDSIKATMQLNTDIRLLKPSNTAMRATVFSGYQAFADSSQGTIIASLYEQVLGVWILPWILTEDPSLTDSTLTQRWQFIQGEPYLASLSSGVDGVLLSDLHMAYAARMTKAKLGVEDDWVDFFREAAQKGRGGILSSLVASFVSNAFPSIGPIAKSIANILPF